MPTNKLKEDNIETLNWDDEVSVSDLTPITDMITLANRIDTLTRWTLDTSRLVRNNGVCSRHKDHVALVEDLAQKMQTDINYGVKQDARLVTLEKERTARTKSRKSVVLYFVSIALAVISAIGTGIWIMSSLVYSSQDTSSRSIRNEGSIKSMQDDITGEVRPAIKAISNTLEAQDVQLKAIAEDTSDTHDVLIGLKKDIEYSSKRMHKSR